MDMSGFSQEQLRAFTAATNTLKDLSAQQVEVLKKVLDSETDIGKLRISYLEKFFDVYSKNLDAIARRQSELSDEFLILSKKAAENTQKQFQSFNKKATENAQRQNFATSENGSKDYSNRSNTRKNDKAKNNKNNDDSKNSTNSPKKTRAKSSESSKSSTTDDLAELKKQSATIKNFVDEEKLAKLNAEDEYTEEKLKKAKQISDFLREQAKLAYLDQQRYDDEIAKTRSVSDVYEKKRYDERLRQRKQLAKQEKALIQDLMALNNLRHQDEVDKADQITAFRISRWQEVTDAQIATQELVNSIAAELDYANQENYLIDTAKDTNENLIASNNPTIEKSTDDSGTTKAETTENTDNKSDIVEIVAPITKIPINDSGITDIDALMADKPSDNLDITELAAKKESQPAEYSGIKDISLNTTEKLTTDSTGITDLNNNTTTQAVIDSSITKISDILADMPARDSHINEAGVRASDESFNADRLKAAKAMEKDIAEYRAKRELELKRKNNGILSKEDATKIQKELADRFKIQSLNDEKLIAKRAKLEADQAQKKELKDDLENFRKGETFEERREAFKELTRDSDGSFNAAKAISAAVLAVSDLAKQLEAKIDSIGKYKSVIDTRLQGSNNKTTMFGSYWDQLVKDMTSIGAINPFYKQEDFANNIQNLVQRGISFDLKQRAFLMTIQEKIADTFDVANGTLLRLVRIQQQDSTAGRLGMESALNSFLNEMYETSEYLSDVASSVRSSLEEMEALMEGAEATEVEYQIQKWLGSLYSVGMSQSAVQSISNALGQIAAGEIEGLTNGGAGNLLVMAANEAGLSIADILTDGINSEDTNKLLQAAVNYLAELSESAQDNKVVQQQLANVFGVRASDLRAATNLVIPGSTNDIFGNNLTYDGMISQLMQMAGSMGSRTSMGELMTNFWENGQYTLASGMASNPVSYFIYKMAKVVDDAAGGIDLPFVNVMGFGVDLNTTVSDLMRVAAVGAGLLGSIGPLISGLGSSFSGRAMLNKLGIGNSSGLEIVTRGGSGGGAVGAAGGTVSESGTLSGSFAGNASGNDIKNSTIQEANDNKKQLMIEAKEEEEASEINVISQTVLQIYELLNEVTTGDRTFRVRVDNYGLTKAGSSANGALGGVGGLENNLSDSNSLQNGLSNSYGGGSVGSGGVNSTGVSGSIDLGGWTMV